MVTATTLDSDTRTRSKTKKNRFGDKDVMACCLSDLIVHVDVGLWLVLFVNLSQEFTLEVGGIGQGKRWIDTVLSFKRRISVFKNKILSTH